MRGVYIWPVLLLSLSLLLFLSRSLRVDVSAHPKLCFFFFSFAHAQSKQKFWILISFRDLSRRVYALLCLVRDLAAAPRRGVKMSTNPFSLSELVLSAVLLSRHTLVRTGRWIEKESPQPGGNRTDAFCFITNEFVLKKGLVQSGSYHHIFEHRESSPALTSEGRGTR